MAWIELHQGLREHRKLFACAEMLNLSRVEMIGTLVSLWLWALDNAQGGSLRGVSNRTLANVCGWPEKKADKLVGALKDTGWLDETEDGLAIHDWTDYAGKLMERREKDKKRKQESRKKEDSGAGCPQDVRRTEDGQAQDVREKSCATVPKPYLNHNRNNSALYSADISAGTAQEARALLDGKSFTAFWESYPNKSDRGDAWEVWKRLSPDAKTAADIQAGLTAWKQSGQWRDDGGRYIPTAAKWLEKRRWEWAPPPGKQDVPKGASGELGDAELEAIQRVLKEGEQ